jgi:hypothetical protein
MLCIYRISDEAQTSTVKPKLPHATKRYCLKQFLEIFGRNNTMIIADSVANATYDHLKEVMGEYANNIIRTSFKSGAYSFLVSVRVALNLSLDENTPVYLCEDDYLHQPHAKQLLLEGLEVADYCSVYDHPDKYMVEHTSPCTLYVTPSTHWRTTPSTTMTFVTRMRTLREDAEVYQMFCQTGYPFDHEMFLALRDKGRRLVTSIPAASTHTELDWLAPLVDWK